MYSKQSLNVPCSQEWVGTHDLPPSPSMLGLQECAYHLVSLSSIPNSLSGNWHWQLEITAWTKGSKVICHWGCDTSECFVSLFTEDSSPLCWDTGVSMHTNMQWVNFIPKERKAQSIVFQKLVRPCCLVHGTFVVCTIAYYNHRMITKSTARGRYLIYLRKL